MGKKWVAFNTAFLSLSWLAIGGTFISWSDVTIEETSTVKFTTSEGTIPNVSKIIVVDRRGGGDSLTVQGAVDMVPDFNAERVKILILPGVYRERVEVPITKPYVSFIGNSNRSSSTVITWHSKASDDDGGGGVLGTYRSASVTVLSDYFCASSVTFENTVVAEPGVAGMQAVALRITGDRAFFYNVNFRGTQDTLLDDWGTHYFYKCSIQGSVDFIFGRARSLFQNCVILSVAPRYGAIAAHRRDSTMENTGFSFVNCVIKGTGRVLLGRAWGNYSRIIYAYTFIDDIIDPIGWSDWSYPERRKTVEFGEFACIGKGSNMTRAPWVKPLTAEMAKPYIDKAFIGGDQWLRL